MVKENKNQIFNDYNSKGVQEIVSITYEEIGFFPRSFSRVLDRFLKQVLSDVDNLVIQEYRFYRYLFLTTLKCLLILFVVPFLVNFFAKNYLVRPLTEYFWNTQQNEIFLNSYQQKRAFAELKDFEEKIYFESLINVKDSPGLADAKNSLRAHPSFFFLPEGEKGRANPLGKNSYAPAPALRESRRDGQAGKLNSPYENSPVGQGGQPEQNMTDQENDIKKFVPSDALLLARPSLRESRRVNSPYENPVGTGGLGAYASTGIRKNQESPLILEQKPTKRDFFEQRLQEKTIELALCYNNQSIEAITNFFADLISFITLCYLLFALEIQINITKSFLLEVFFGLDDSKKSLLILLITDLLVGYHSSNLWELFFEFLFTHYGLPESQTGIFLLVATLPVLLDVLFKYLIFRHLNRSSPATVATYHAMIE